MKKLYPRQIMATIALDGNNDIYPIAYGVMEV